MGFVDIAIADLAADYGVSVETVCGLCDRLGIRYTSPQTRLPLEDAKAIILALTDSATPTDQRDTSPHS
ncbi:MULTISPECIES: translation initiation factor IF-2 [unclassified Thermosynechococcus]|uniref:translation initiation factor IF-2 n=1 Tax=unclassified Thermosynechococcus TaxID=2622553 RepID=UPI00197FA5F6|nr:MULTISPECIES: translation initiation factor IF-2 [unclassified Thermosynechococcus]MDR5638484.1 translation initiation factor IF-2 [Thermosynechococcus sp. PP42]MDR7899186.1 translation initiation factor IF-2 [Thermosynechococcus sp. JY1332]MDR7906594.1 translation initiation factor IF-2 [Thermosynechococcus sp. JY1334]MDR7921177.1 translation initiation factor IF-2 [Thermosynechococcus sp. HY213]MDR7994415.1 translation initiation factor IF-2 [Thermosynechococcus sp. TG252]